MEKAIIAAPNIVINGLVASLNVCLGEYPPPIISKFGLTSQFSILYSFITCKISFPTSS